MFEICLGITIIVCIILIIYILARQSGPVSIDKKTDGTSTTLAIRAKRDIKSMEIRIQKDSGGPVFRRKAINKDELIQFVFPATDEEIEITVVDLSGTHTLKA